MKSIIIHSEAIAELDDAIGYYEEQQTGLGFELLLEVEQSLEKLQRNLNMAAPYKIIGLRRYVMQHFPFLIFYTELDEFIWVVAIAHSKLRPDYWRNRKLERP